MGEGSCGGGGVEGVVVVEGWRELWWWRGGGSCGGGGVEGIVVGEGVVVEWKKD